MRDQAYSLADDLPPAREPLEPIITGWRDVVGILAGTAVLLLCFIALLVWTVILPATQVQP